MKHAYNEDGSYQSPATVWPWLRCGFCGLVDCTCDHETCEQCSEVAACAWCIDCKLPYCALCSGDERRCISCVSKAARAHKPLRGLAADPLPPWQADAPCVRSGKRVEACACPSCDWRY